MRYKLTGSTALSKNCQPRSTRKELLRVDEETGKPYRDYSHHIDKERTPWNKVLVNRNVFDVYKEHIGPGINEYNARQIACGHPERCKTVEGYISQLLQGEKAKNSRKRPRLWNDIIVQCGNMISNESYIVNKNGKKEMPRLAQISNDVYEEFVSEFQKMFPNLIVTLSCTHNDESCPHAMIQYVALCHKNKHKNKRGLPVEVKLLDALAESLDALGVPYNRTRDDGVKHAFNKVLDEMLTNIMRKHGIERIPGEKKENKDLESVPVAELRKRHRILREQIKKMIDNGENPLDTIKAKNMLVGTYYSERDVRGVIQELQKQNALLRAQIKTEEEIDKRNNIILYELKKRQEIEINRAKADVDEKRRESEKTLIEARVLKQKLRDKDEQHRYKMLSDSVCKKEQALNTELAEVKEIKENARQNAEIIIEKAKQEIDAMYKEYGKSSAGKRQRDIIQLELLASKYPDIAEQLNAEAGNIMLKQRRCYQAKEMGQNK